MNDTTFNLSDVISTAIQIRRAGASLYCRLAMSARDNKLREVFLSLARWEQSQGSVFKDMLAASLFQRQSLGVEGKHLKHFHDMAHRLFGPEMLQAFQAAERPLDVLPLAAYTEDYIAFIFANINGFIAGAGGKLVLNRILAEESKYTMFLNQQWTALEEDRPMAFAPSAQSPQIQTISRQEQHRIREPVVVTRCNQAS
jgi:hypothetical protein